MPVPRRGGKGSDGGGERNRSQDPGDRTQGRAASARVVAVGVWSLRHRLRWQVGDVSFDGEEGGLEADGGIAGDGVMG